jgi:hypothetical protein
MARSPLVGESDAEEHDIIPCAPLTSRSAALDTNHLKVDGAKNSEHRNQHTAVSTDQQGRTDRQARHSVREGLNWHAAHCGHPERHVAPLSMLVAKPTMSSTLLWGAVPLGAPASLSAAAARVSSGLAGAVKAAIAKSKLCKNEADTVRPAHDCALRPWHGHGRAVCERAVSIGHVARERCQKLLLQHTRRTPNL